MLILHSFFQISGYNRDRGHADKLYTNYCRVNVRKHFFCNQVVAIWNALDAAATDFNTLASFKQFLNTADLLQYPSFCW